MAVRSGFARTGVARGAGERHSSMMRKKRQAIAIVMVSSKDIRLTIVVRRLSSF
jgi:hypothetical protein